MIQIVGKYGEAVIHNEEVEQSAFSQIQLLMNQPMAEGSHVRVMPDVHAGSGCVIGYTAKLTDKIVPNLIGVDIGCGVSAWNLGILDIDYEGLDKAIRYYVPSGKNMRESRLGMSELRIIYDTLPNPKMHWHSFVAEINRIVKDLKLKSDRVWNSIGTLGGGNHFIEIDEDKSSGEKYLTIHSGSRNLGLQIANHHQKLAINTLRNNNLTEKNKEEMEKIIQYCRDNNQEGQIGHRLAEYKSEIDIKVPRGLEYLEEDMAANYFYDMNIAQLYAQLNRRVMGYMILQQFFRTVFYAPVESVHNYIDFNSKIIRKGAISAEAGEPVIIPLNMADGVIIGMGKGNEEFNYSAPHGAGRKLSRSKAKEKVSLDEYQERMKEAGVWSSCVSRATIDESPQAYKDADEITKYLEPTVKVKARLKPVYNFKATE